MLAISMSEFSLPAPHKLVQWAAGEAVFSLRRYSAVFPLSLVFFPNIPRSLLTGRTIRVTRTLKSESRKKRMAILTILFRREEATRTPDPHVPNVVRYQLRYFSKAAAKILLFSHLCKLFRQKISKILQIMRICALLVAFLPFVGCMYYPLLVAFSPLFLLSSLVSCPYPALHRFVIIFR